MVTETELQNLEGCGTCGLPRSYYSCDETCKVPAGVTATQLAAFVVKRRCLLEHEDEVLRHGLERLWPTLPIEDQKRVREEDQGSRAVVLGYWKARG
jgi:hypothetical protein